WHISVGSIFRAFLPYYNNAPLIPLHYIWAPAWARDFKRLQQRPITFANVSQSPWVDSHDVVCWWCSSRIDSEDTALVRLSLRLAFGGKADIASCPLYSKSGHSSSVSGGPLFAKSRHSAR